MGYFRSVKVTYSAQFIEGLLSQARSSRDCPTYLGYSLYVELANLGKVKDSTSLTLGIKVRSCHPNMLFHADDDDCFNTVTRIWHGWVGLVLPILPTRVGLVLPILPTSVGLFLPILPSRVGLFLPILPSRVGLFLPILPSTVEILSPLILDVFERPQCLKYHSIYTLENISGQSEIGAALKISARANSKESDVISKNIFTFIEDSAWFSG
ncbi:hypothetical protein RRG08_020007 [Elysia crispata]|uniref:Uncharacterized protein n=1 Tax=Elysia crispata TaxID=231223 RepID=A0AAE1ECW3_9GAST|nr:hypothetical protein RRG08_020007 [Elysia crispata]